MKELYVLISWPEIQDFMEHERKDGKSVYFAKK